MAQQIQAWNDADGLLETTGTGVTFAASGVSETVKCHPYPGETYTKVYGNRIMGKYLKSDIPVLPQVSGVTNHPQACLRTTVRKNDNPTAQTIDYVEDYSYEDISGVQKFYKKTDTVNGHLDSRMYAMYSKYVELTGATIDVSWGEIANVNVSPTTLFAWSQGAYDTITINSNVPWTISATTDWIITSVSGGGTGTTVVNVSINPNQTLSARTGDIEIIYQDYRGTITEVISVTQETIEPIWNVSPTGVTFSQEGGSDDIQNIWIQTNLPLNYWSYTVPEWITANLFPVALNNYRLACVADNNIASLVDRTGNISISHIDPSGTYTDIINVRQTGGMLWNLSPDTLSFDVGGESKTLTLVTNLPQSAWNVTYPSWVTVTTSQTGDYTWTITCTASQNLVTGETREGSIVFTYNAGGEVITETIDIEQDYYNLITYHSSTYMSNYVSYGKYIGKYNYSNGYGEIYVKRSFTTMPYNFFDSGYNNYLYEITFSRGINALGNNAFAGYNYLSSVTLSDTVTTIGNNAFYSSSSGACRLVEVVIPDSVTSIGSSAFMNNPITSLTIGSGLTTVGDSAFRNCSISSVTLPESVRTIGGMAFRGTPIRTLTIPDGVTSIGDSAFEICTQLSSVTIGNGVTTIPQQCFNGCTSLQSVSIGSGVTTIAPAAFYECALTSLTIPDNVVSISANAAPSFGSFQNCTHLSALTLSSGLTTLGSWAFYGCTALQNVVIPQSVTNMGEHTFAYSGLQSVTVNCSNTGQWTFEGCSGLTSHTLNGVTIIGARAFSECGALTNITIPDGVTSIGNYAYVTCTGLTDTVTIPDTVTTIGNSAFAGCRRLDHVIIGSGVTSIGDKAFDGCVGLDDVKLYPTVPPTLGASGGVCLVFDDNNCPLYVPSQSVSTYKDTGWWRTTYQTRIQAMPEPQGNDEIWYTTTNSTTVSINTGSTAQEWAQNIVSNTYSGGKGVIKYNTDITDTPTNFIRGTNIVTIILPNALTVIGQTSFKGCSSLTSLTLPDSLTTIGESSVAECTSLTAVTIPTGVTTINRAAFSGSTSLNNIVFPEGITVLNEFMFRSCSGLNTVSLPSTITSIGDRFFDGCTSLATVNYNGTTSQWQALSKGSYWKNNVPSSCKVYCTNGTINI